MSTARPTESFWDRLCFYSGPSDHGSIHVGLLLLRIFAGVTIAGAGLDKLPTSTWFAGQVGDIGFPLPSTFAFLAAFSEFAGGWLIVVGLLARPSAFLIAFTMGVASITIHAEVPFFGLNIARLYFWVFLGLTFTGAGRFSLDQLVRTGALPKTLVVIIPLLLLGYGGYREWVFEPEVQEPVAFDPQEIQQMSVAGSFNNWDLTATPMEQDEQGVWKTTVEIEESGPIEFKFAANEDWALNTGAPPEAKSAFPLQAVGLISLNANPENIKAYIPRAGSYEFTFDPSDFSYSLDATSLNATKNAEEAGNERPASPGPR